MKPILDTQERRSIIEGKTFFGALCNFELHRLKFEREIIRKIQNKGTPELILIFSAFILIANIINILID